MLSPWTSYNCPPTTLWDNRRISTDYLSIVVTLKIRPMSPDLYELFVMSQWNMHANLVTIRPHNHKLACSQAFSCHIQYGSLSLTVTLKMRSMSQKSNKLFFSIPSKCPWLLFIIILSLSYLISVRQALFAKNDSLSFIVTLKIRSRSS